MPTPRGRKTNRTTLSAGNRETFPKLSTLLATRWRPSVSSISACSGSWRNSPDKCSDHRMNNRPMETAIPHYRRSNSTSAPPKTMMEEEKIAISKGMIPTYSSEMIETKERLIGTMEVKSRPPIRGERRNDLRSNGFRTSNKGDTELRLRRN